MTLKFDKNQMENKAAKQMKDSKITASDKLQKFAAIKISEKQETAFCRTASEPYEKFYKEKTR